MSINNKNIYAHRFSYELHNGPIGKGLFVCHTCDTPPCVNPEHLWLGSNADNIRDAVTKGRVRNVIKRGSSNGFSKLTEADVLQIRAMASQKMKYQDIGTHFGVDCTTVGLIVRRKTWTHI